jgi:N-acetylmuramoyl-L-alanine amidase
MANDWGAHAFVSIHCNAFNNPAAHGYEVWTNPEADPADYLAGLMWYRFREQFPDMRGRADFSDDDPDKESHFYVLTHTSMPAVLFELAFITNPQDEARLLSPAWQARASLALANAIKEWAS